MVIDEIIPEEFGWHIFAHDIQEEKCYLVDENKRIPIVIELTDYVANTYIWHGRTS